MEWALDRTFLEYTELMNTRTLHRVLTVRAEHLLSCCSSSRILRPGVFLKKLNCDAIRNLTNSITKLC